MQETGDAGDGTELSWLEGLRRVLGQAHLWRPDQVAATVNAAMAPLGVRTRLWLVDYEQVALRPLAEPGEPTPDPVPIDGSLAGRAFTRVESTPAEGDDDDGGRWWVPMVDGTDRMGVMEIVTSPRVDTTGPAFLKRCELLSGLVGHLITTTSMRGDLLDRTRRSRPMSTAAEMLWRLLPPLTSACDRAVVSVVLQPCYDVGGDGFDYALDEDVVHLAVLDAMGRGLRAGLACSVALAAIRATRRAGRGLYDQARAVDAALTEQFADVRFATAVLAELDLGTGRLRYVNAGHLPPLVLRRGRVVRELPGGRRMPLGVDDPVVEVGEEMLEPGDALVLYTDGFTEARTADGGRFGLPRLIDLIERHADGGLPPAETLRRLAHAVVRSQGGDPDDDATLMLVQWSGDAAMASVPKAAVPQEGTTDDG